MAELVFDWRNVNGIDRVVLTRVAYRKQTTIEQWTQADSTDGVVQRKSGGKTVSIPFENLIVLSHKREGDNWEGVSILRSAFQNWYYKQTFYRNRCGEARPSGIGCHQYQTPKGAAQTMLNRPHTPHRRSVPTSVLTSRNQMAKTSTPWT